MKCAKVVNTHSIMSIHISKLNITKSYKEKEYMSHAPYVNAILK